MRNLLITTLFAVSAAGCIIYDEELIYDDQPPPDDRDDDRPDRPADEDPDEDPEELVLGLVPDTAPAGDVLIVALQAETGTLGQVVDLEFFGDADIEILTTQRRDDELLMTLDIPSTAPASANHLLVDFESGDTVFVEDAFVVQ